MRASLKRFTVILGAAKFNPALIQEVTAVLLLNKIILIQ